VLLTDISLSSASPNEPSSSGASYGDGFMAQKISISARFQPPVIFEVSLFLKNGFINIFSVITAKILGSEVPKSRKRKSFQEKYEKMTN
jgi:hypothetical protein